MTKDDFEFGEPYPEAESKWSVPKTVRGRVTQTIFHPDGSKSEESWMVDVPNPYANPSDTPSPSAPESGTNGTER